MKKNSSRKVSLIHYVAGQGDSYLSEKSCEGHGIKRRASSFDTQRIDYLYQDIHEQGEKLRLHYGGLPGVSNLTRIVKEVQTDEVNKLGAESHVAVSLEAPEHTANVDPLGTIRFLRLESKTRFYQASSSKLYGLVQETPQTDKTPFYPRSPYSVAKLYDYPRRATWIF